MQKDRREGDNKLAREEGDRIQYKDTDKQDNETQV